MSRYQLKLLVLSLAAVTSLVAALFVIPWFRIDIAGNYIELDLREGRACVGSDCQSVSLSRLRGMYPTLGAIAFWSSLPLLLGVGVQAGSRFLSTAPQERLAKLGYTLGSIVFVTGFAAGYVFGPELGSAEGGLISIERTWSPALFLVGALLASFTMRYALTEEVEDSTEYKPVVVRRDARIPVTPLSVNKVPTPVTTPRLPDSLPLEGGRPKVPTTPPAIARTTSPQVEVRMKPSTNPPPVDPRTRPATNPGDVRLRPATNPPAIARTTSPTQQPLMSRTTSPTQQPLMSRTTSPTQQPLLSRTKSPSSNPGIGLDLPPRPRTSSSGPVDVAARLGGAPIEVAIRPPLPEPAPIPADQIPVAPESGLTIRKRTPSAGPIPADAIPVVPDLGLVIRKKPPSIAPAPTMPSISIALADPTPPKLRGRVNYATTSVAFSGAGITAHREDGLSKLVKWDEIVGIVARRLPQAPPHDGATFVDIVSTAGSTLRILPWTEITGHTLDDNDPVERARGLVQLLAAQCLDAKLDQATQTFANTKRSAAQLPDEKTLATHDERLA